MKYILAALSHVDLIILIALTLASGWVAFSFFSLYLYLGRMA